MTYHLVLTPSRLTPPGETYYPSSLQMWTFQIQMWTFQIPPPTCRVPAPLDLSSYANIDEPSLQTTPLSAASIIARFRAAASPETPTLRPPSAPVSRGLSSTATRTTAGQRHTEVAPRPAICRRPVATNFFSPPPPRTQRQTCSTTFADKVFQRMQGNFASVNESDSLPTLSPPQSPPPETPVTSSEAAQPTHPDADPPSTSPTGITPPTTPEIPMADHSRPTSPTEPLILPDQPLSSPPANTPASPITEGPAGQRFPSPPNAERLDAFRNQWTTTFGGELDWLDFSAHCVSFAQQCVVVAKEVQSSAPQRPTQRRPDRPSARPPPGIPRQQRFDPAEARRLQTLYRHSRKRAARKVLADESPIFDGTTDAAQTFFTNIFSHKPCDTEALAEQLNRHVPTMPVEESLFFPPTAEEVSNKLRQMSNCAPGKNRVEYRHLRIIDPKGLLLASIFGHCIEQQNVPDVWKTATTILIHKKGATDDVSCIYKLLMGILAKRMSSWAIEHDLLSTEQKSARPSEGCYEHGFVLQSVIGDARRLQKDIFVAWLDLRNAFGSVPHAAVFTALNHMGFPPDLIMMLRNTYTNATTEVRTSSGTTDTIPINAGVKQGCPMSPILFQPHPGTRPA